MKRIHQSEDHDGKDFVGVLNPNKRVYLGVNPKIGGKTPKMDGENNGKAY